MNGLDADRPGRLREASEWLVRLRSDPKSESVLAEWLVWREQSPENAAAFDEAQQFWHQVEQVYPDRSEVDRLLSTGTAIRPRPSAKEWWRERVCMRFSARIPRYAFGATALAVLLFAGAAAWQMSNQAGDSMPFLAGASNRTVTLPDGSVVDLAPRTSVTVSFLRHERRLTLVAGEAFFQVRPDSSRPFTVNAGQLDVTAVGTAFDVKRTPGLLTVTVQDGVVSAVPLSQDGFLASKATWRVGAGSRLAFSEKDAAATVSSVQNSAAFSWRDGRLEYINAPLSAIVDDLNRYASVPVELQADSVGRLTFTGTVFTASAESWLEALPRVLPVRIERETSGRTRIVADNQ